MMNIDSSDNSIDQFVYKYRPSNIDEMVLTDELKKYFKSMIANKKLTNMTLVGSPGYGKTTLAQCLTNEIDGVVHFVKCAIDGKVDYISTTLKPFCDSMSMDGRQKIVILDELDSASSTQQNSFQKALRSLIESASDTIFICTANYKENIIPAILSRCPLVNISFSPKDLLVRVKQILDSEKIEYTVDELKMFFKEVVKKSYPDIRTILNHLQRMTSNKKLEVCSSSVTKTGQEDNSETTEFIKNIVALLSNKDTKAVELRTFCIQNKDFISDYQEFSSKIFNHLIDNRIVTNGKTIMRMADILFQMSQSIDKEIQFFNFLITVMESMHPVV